MTTQPSPTRVFIRRTTSDKQYGHTLINDPLVLPREINATQAVINESVVLFDEQSGDAFHRRRATDCKAAGVAVETSDDVDAYVGHRCVLTVLFDRQYGYAIDGLLERGEGGEVYIETHARNVTNAAIDALG